MSPESKQLYSFLCAIHDNPRDMQTRAVFADWLEEHDEPELADEQREFSLEKYDAEQYLKDFTNRYSDGEDWREVLAGLTSGEYCFGHDDGPDEARTDSRLHEAVRILTEERLDDEHFTNGSFRCAC